MVATEEKLFLMKAFLARMQCGEGEIVMIFDKKKIKLLADMLQQQKQELIQSQDEQTSQLNTVMEKNQKAVRRLSDAVEDFLDSLQEEDKKERYFNQELTMAAEREQKLLGLVELYQEQMELLEQQTGGIIEAGSEAVQEAWKQQYQMMKRKIAAESSLCGIELVGEEGEPVDYRVHEILEAVDTDRGEQEGMVAGVRSRGLLYKGKVIKKARVTAYRKARG